jgi:protein TonB
MAGEWSCVTCDHSVTSSDQSMWARHRVVLIWLFVSLPVWAGPQAGNKQAETEKEASEPVYELGEGITPPRLIRQVNPEYSGKKGVGVKGSVAIALVVNSKGIPENPKVVQGLDPDIDKSAVEAIKQWRFSPAQKDKKPVAVKVTVEVQFRSM